MTILARVVRPGIELTVCGDPSPAWLDWLLTADVPLTACQVATRERHRANVERRRRESGGLV